MKKLISSAKRSIRKKQTIAKILKSEQHNEPVANVHRIDTRNAGDYYCAPHHYFEVLKGKSLDIFGYKSDDNDKRQNFIDTVNAKSLIIGGGGLLNRSGFNRQMKLFEKLSEQGKKTVLWGVGHNEKHPHTYDKVKHYNVDVSKFGIAGTRDYKMPGDYVPCVSCLHPIFDKPFEETQDFGIVFHKDTLKKPEILAKFQDYPTSSNTSDFEELINFIKASNKIVSDSYHVMYWSMLLGKKVVVVPNSSKFYDFQHRPVISDFDNALNQFSKTDVYPELLEECRAINMNFSEKVFDYLNL
ncbi:polysaccharide pyruvyl transferase family protein [Psychroserpens sp. MEBiC05023]